MQYQDLPLTSCQNVRDIYDDLVLSEINQQDPHDAPDGALYRKDGVDVTSASQNHKGLVPESTIIEYMAKALDVLNTSKNALINIAAFHYLLKMG